MCLAKARRGFPKQSRGEARKLNDGSSQARPQDGQTGVE